MGSTEGRICFCAGIGSAGDSGGIGGGAQVYGVSALSALVTNLREENQVPIFLNADHTHSLKGAIAAAKAGFDSIVFDRSELPFEENIRTTKQAVGALKSINPAILVEGEIGDIGTGSEIHDRALDGSKSPHHS